MPPACRAYQCLRFAAVSAKRVVQGGVLGVAAVLALGAACTRRVPPPELVRQSNGTTVTLRRESLPFVTVEPARVPPTVAQHAYVGRVDFDERRVARLGPPVGGRVTAVNVIVGDTVRNAQVLASIHSGDIATALAQVAPQMHFSGFVVPAWVAVMTLWVALTSGWRRGVPVIAAWLGGNVHV